MKFLTAILLIHLITACSVSSSKDPENRETLDDQVAYLSDSKEYKVIAEWSQPLVAGESHRESNTVELYFYTADNHEVNAIAFSADDFKPFMPTMGHGNHDNRHQIRLEAAHAYISHIYFNMGSTSDHKWVILLDANIEGTLETFKIEVPEVGGMESGDSEIQAPQPKPEHTLDSQVQQPDSGSTQELALLSSDNGWFFVSAHWSSPMLASSAGRENNWVKITFYADENVTTAGQVEFTADDFRPYMPTMGHGNFDNHHMVYQNASEPYIFRVENILFNMPNMGNHSWVILLDAQVNGSWDSITIPVPTVNMPESM